METTSTARLLCYSNASPRLRDIKRSCLFFCCFGLIAFWTSASAQTPKITITEPVLTEAQDAIKIAFKVSGASQKRIRVKVDAGASAVTSDEIKFATDGEHVINVNLFKGLNTITLVGFVNDEPVDSLVRPFQVKCNGRWCREPFSLKPDTVASEFKESGGSATPGQGSGTPSGQADTKPPETTAQKGDVHINKPKKDVHYVDAATVPLSITVDQESDTAKNVKTVFVTVLSDGQPIVQKDNPVQITYPSDPKKSGELATAIKIGKGTNNRIIVFDPTQPDAQRDEVQIICEGDKCGGAASAKAQGIHIDSPEGGAQLQDAAYALSKITVKKDSNITKVFVRVLNNGKPLEKPLVGDGESLDVTFETGKTEAVLKPKIRVGKGTNVITVFDAAKSIDDSPQDSTEVTCVGGCGTAAAESESEIAIVEPTTEGDTPYAADTSSIDSYVTVAKGSKIKKIQYDVWREGKTVLTSDPQLVGTTTEKAAKVKVKLKFLRGKNTVTIYNAENRGDGNEAKIVIDCTGDMCASDFDIAKYPSSQNSRAVVGMEQAGASSATSETKPFLDFFFTTPLLFPTCPLVTITSTEDDRKKAEKCEADKLPSLGKFGAWGQIRLASTPDQIAAASVFPSNFVNQLGKSGNTVDLVQSFDFLAGLEFRVKSSNGHFLSLIPGINQRTHFYVAAGGGAINPLTAKRELAQLFKIPKDNSPQFADFIERYGTPPASTPLKEFVGLVPLDRDRFLRQWYAGIRLKTFYCDNTACTKFKNNFPAIVDFMIGQNEAVTGGSLKYSLLDPNDKTKTIEKNAYVLRFDAFYPFPIKEANFLYFYGTALMKIGAGGVRVQTPLFLDTAPGDVLITDTRVYIPPTQLQKLFQPNRDYYKIGVGINLTELFNRNKTSQ